MFFSFLAGVPYVSIELQGTSPTIFGAWWMIASIGFHGRKLPRRETGRTDRVEQLARVGTMLPILGVALVAAGYAALPGEVSALFVADHARLDRNGMTMPGASANALSVRPDLAGAASGLSGACSWVRAQYRRTAVHFPPIGWPMITIMAVTPFAALSVCSGCGKATSAVADQSLGFDRPTFG